MADYYQGINSNSRLIAASTWGHRWAGKTIRAFCDNMAVVHIINSRQSRDPDVIRLLRCLSLIESTLDFNITSKYLPGVHNDLADALSWNNCAYFLSHFPQAHPVPSCQHPSQRCYFRCWSRQDRTGPP